MHQKTSVRPYLIAFEGIDGAGKSTQIKLSLDFLKDRGIAAERSAEPTKGVHGCAIRNAVVRLDAGIERALFVADRREHVKELIEPTLERGVSVLLDRYFYSSMAYQGSRLDALDPGLIASGDEAAIEAALIQLQGDIYLENRVFAPEADVLIYLDLPVELALVRIRARREKLDPFETAVNLERVSRAFKRLLIQHPNAVVIDASRPIESVWSSVEAQLKRIF